MCTVQLLKALKNPFIWILEVILVKRLSALIKWIVAIISPERILYMTKSISARDCFSNSHGKNQPRRLYTLSFMIKSYMFRWDFPPSSFPSKHSLVWVYLENLLIIHMILCLISLALYSCRNAPFLKVKLLLTPKPVGLKAIYPVHHLLPRV